jgi:hypothetical protein
MNRFERVGMNRLLPPAMIDFNEFQFLAFSAIFSHGIFFGGCFYVPI